MSTVTAFRPARTIRIAPVLADTARSTVLIGLLGAVLATGALFAAPTYADPQPATVAHIA